MIYAVGVDWKTTGLAARERCALPEAGIAGFLQAFAARQHVAGVVLLQTCNRFELYLQGYEGTTLRENLLDALGFGAEETPPTLFLDAGRDAEYRLMEIACGLQSQILGEEQILTQVRSAIETARQAGTTTPELETLFRLAVTAGKAARTQVQLQSVPTSSAHKAVELAAQAVGGLAGKKALVTGNGKMGRLAAELLYQAGAEVTITLRSYRHGETTVPTGAKTVAYDERQQAAEGVDILISATRSPHFTYNREMLEALEQRPEVVIDVAIPRDLDPAIRDLSGILFFDMDDLQDGSLDNQSPEIVAVRGIIEKNLDDYAKWVAGREKYTKRQEKIGPIAVFAGTTEGRLLAEHLYREGKAATVFVATEYGSSLMPMLKGVEVHTGRLSAEEMVLALKDFDVVVDATHPYAKEASQNIMAAARAGGKEYLRLLRPPSALREDEVVTVPDARAAADYLSDKEGNILLTTGSKELDIYTAILDYSSRVYPRVLPNGESLGRCLELGYEQSHIICMQGPFSKELNAALLKSTEARWLVTKDTGVKGGFPEKIAAAQEADVNIIVIDRPQEQASGLDFDEVCLKLTGTTPLAVDDRGDRFPLFVDLTDRLCLVVGAGTVGTRRARVLKNFGAKVTLLGQKITDAPQGVEVIERDYHYGDAATMDLVVAATNDRSLNHAIYQECRKRKIPVSVADAPEECSFFFPAICQSKHLTAGIVSQGDRHHLVSRTATAVRSLLEEIDS